ncbi:Developmental regulator [Pleurostoma richardsiae]|uniref:Developmental regulator n=1 Tax=Pleurostoma richardsiae TaxID=41990 RepID=A0AA38RZN1_9PEZI|nr:Developmental regulator [Pleurostoma richardsiae]
MSYSQYTGAPLGYPAQALSAPPQSTDSEEDYEILIVQQPEHAKVAQGKEKDRKPIDPPPILQLIVSEKMDPQRNFLQSPYFFMSCSLLKEKTLNDSKDAEPNSLIGTVVSSLHRLKYMNNSDGGFFVFGDLSVRTEGTWRLKFSLYKMADRECMHIKSIISEPFVCHTAKTFPGMAESTFLTRSFSDQGVRLRLRKDSRSIATRKRNNAAAEFARQNSSHDRESQEHQRQGDPLRRTNSLSDSVGPLTPVDRVPALPSSRSTGHHEHQGVTQGELYRGLAGTYSGYTQDHGPPPKRPRMHADDANHSFKQEYTATSYSPQILSQVNPQVTSGVQQYSPYTMAGSIPSTSVSVYAPSSQLARMNPQLNTQQFGGQMTSQLNPPHQLNTQFSSYQSEPNTADAFSPRQSPGGPGGYHPYAPGNAVNPAL